MIKNIIPLGIITFCVGCIAFTNTTSHTYLMGWDNLMPELNSQLNIFRSLFAVWQEYQGLGLVGGMGHAADFIHQIEIALLSFILPQELLRYFYTYSMLFLGTTGVFYFIKNWIIPRDMPEVQKTVFALLGSFFYLFNLATVQMFYTPYETFTTHFGFLPWILSFVLFCFFYGRKKDFILLATILFLATPAAYVPTIFLVTIGAVILILATLFFSTPTRIALKRIGSIFVVFFFINAFWLFPFVYFLTTHSSVIFASKINQMATQVVYEQNKVFGHIPDFMLLKGFIFNTLDPTASGQLAYMLQPWKDYLQSVLVESIGYLFFGVIFIGVIACIVRKTPLSAAFLFVFGVCAAALLTEVFPFSILNIILRSLPFLNEAFRFPFTKFSTLTSFVFSIFFSCGLIYFYQYIQKKIHHSSYLLVLFGCVTLTLFTIYMFPIFQGHFFYSKNRIVLPREYQDLFTFFNHQNPTDRIALLPLDNFWGWDFTSWGYSGSGFLWYAIPQPILHNTFDVWSSEDEGFYWEFSQAIYSQNAPLMKNVLTKYQVRYVLLDGNRISTSPQSLQIPQTKNLLINAGLHLEKSFGKISVYSNTFQSTVTLAQNLPTVNSYSFGNIDQAYLQHGSYQSISESNSNYTLGYPLRTLFTQRSPQEKEFSLQDFPTSLVFSNTIPPRTNHLLIPSFSQVENLIPATFSLQKNTQGRYAIYSTVTTPLISIDGKKIWGDSFSYPLLTLPKNPAFPLTITLNGQPLATLYKLSDEVLITTLLTLTQNNIVTITDAKKGGQDIPILPSTIRRHIDTPTSITCTPSSQPMKFSVRIPKITDPIYSYSPEVKNAAVTNCNNLQQGTITSSYHQGLFLSASLADACFSFYNAQAFTNEGYAVFITHSHIQGQPLGFWVEDTTDGYAFSQINLSNKTSSSIDSLILPPMQSNNLGYSFHFDNTATGTDITQNTLSRLSVYPIPYTFLQSIEADTQQTPTTPTITPVAFDHPNPSLYIIPNFPNTPGTLSVSQAYDDGWKAYVMSSQNAKGKIQNSLETIFPFWLGTELTDHVKVNNWENGWNIQESEIQKFSNSEVNGNTQSSIVIVFLPQYLEYIGFVLLIGFWIYLIYRKQNSST